MAGMAARGVVQDAVSGNILTGQDAGSIGRTQRGYMVGAAEHDTLCGQSVDIGCLQIGMSAYADLIET